jgi:hypothetical protein
MAFVNRKYDKPNRLSIIPTILCLLFLCASLDGLFIHGFRLAELSRHFFSRRSPPEKINNGNGKQEKHVNGS